MKNISKLFLVALLGIAGLSLLLPGLSAQQQAKPWEVPEEYKTMVNPVEKNEASIKTGQGLYTKYCASCHGKTGLGDGVKARMLKDYSGDFSGDYYQGQTDGEHFYKTKTGRNDMPKYEGKLSDENIWHIVNYMRTFKK